jgi:hypothetical protein
MEVCGNLLSVIGSAPASSSAELGQRWLSHLDTMLQAPLESGEDQCVSCILEIMRSELGLEVLKPLWPRVVSGMGTRIASTNDVARAGAVNVLTQWLTSARSQHHSCVARVFLRSTRDSRGPQLELHPLVSKISSSPFSNSRWRG